MSHITLTPSQLYRVLALHDVPPSDKFIAAAGQDYGYVAAWTLVDGYHLIQYGDNGTNRYDIVGDVSDLAVWLESPDLSALDMAVQTANVRGIDAEEEAAEDAEGPFYILVTRYWYGNRESTSLVDSGQNRMVPRTFDTYQSARDWIQETEAETEADGYMLSNNEYAIPTYRIITE